MKKKLIELAPIVLFVYNRPTHTQKTIEALRSNYLAKDSILYVFCDGPKNENAIRGTNEVRSIVNNINGFKKVLIIERDKNYGLANSIISGVTDVVNKHGKIIVLEDDIVTSKYFLKFMNEALDFYRNEERIISIHGYVYPTGRNFKKPFFLKDTGCWGWATWERGWKLFNKNGIKLLYEIRKKRISREFDFNGAYGFTRMLKDQIIGKNDSWAIRWQASTFIKNKLTLYPPFSLVENIGFDRSGINGGNTNDFNVSMINKSVDFDYKNLKIVETSIAKKSYEKYFRKINPYSLVNIIKFQIKKYVK